MLITKSALMIGFVLVTSMPASLAAQPTNRSFDQEIVVFTDHVQKAETAGRITVRQANKLKNKEESIVAKADDLRDDNHGEIRTKDAVAMRSKIVALDEQLANLKTCQKYR